MSDQLREYERFTTINANEIVKPFRNSNDLSGLAVTASSLLPYFALIWLSSLVAAHSYWWVLLLAVPTHWLHARIFIIMHDCGHRSLFKTDFLNDFFGHIAGFCFATPFYMWRELHNKHHQNQGRLQKRGLSLDVWTLTKSEWQAANPLKRLAYRLYRNPIVLFVIAPVILFIIIFRLPFEKFSLKAVLNIFILDFIFLSLILIVPRTSISLLTIVAPSLLISFSAASFLFYIQHQYEKTLWVDEEDFDNRLISLVGSSYLQLGRFFEWCYGNINYHHIHHLDTKIPMYRLRNAHQSLNTVQTLPALSPARAVKSVHLKVWNESTNRLESF